MTAKELIEWLRTVPGSTPVLIYSPNETQTPDETPYVFPDPAIGEVFDPLPEGLQDGQKVVVL